MIKVAVILAVVTVMMTVVVTLAVRGRPMTATWVAPLYGGLVLVVIGMGLYVARSSAQRDYDSCVTRAERSAGARASTLRFYDVIDKLTDPKYTHEPQIPGQPSLRAGLDIDLPTLDPNDCVKP